MQHKKDGLETRRNPQVYARTRKLLRIVKVSTRVRIIAYKKVVWEADA